MQPYVQNAAVVTKALSLTLIQYYLRDETSAILVVIPLTLEGTQIPLELLVLAMER